MIMFEPTNKEPEQSKPKPPTRRKATWLKVMVSVLFAVSWLLWSCGENQSAVTKPEPAAAADQFQPSPDPAAHIEAGRNYPVLAESHYHQPDFAADIRANNSTEQIALNKARQALLNHQPTTVADLVQVAPADYQTEADYLEAHALFEMKNYAQSAVIFNKLTTSARYGEAAQWYSLLAMMPYFERRKAFIINHLKAIASNNGHAFQADAKQLLSEIVY